MVQVDRQWSELIKIGRENQNLLPRVRAWCKNLNVEQVSRGLVVEMTGLPAGMLRVTCPHGISVSESHFLRAEAQDFILSNCADCPHHQEQSPNNFGRDVFAEKGSHDAEAAGVAARRRQLEQEAYTAAEATLATNEITQRSVNTLILKLEKDKEDVPATAERLAEAARLGPELFSDGALQILSDGLRGELGATNAAVIRAVCQSRGRVPDLVLDAAQQAAAHGVDAACALLAEAGRYREATSFLALLPAILAIPDYGMWAWRKPEGYHERPLYPGTTELLGVLLREAPEAVLNALDERLQVDDKDTKLNTAELLFDLLPEQAEPLLTLVRRLIRSLELSDDGYERSADGAVCRMLAHLYAFSPDAVEQEIRRYWPQASVEVQVTLLRVYADVVLYDPERGLGSRRVLPQERYTRHASVTAERLYLALTDLKLGAAERRKVCDLLESVVKQYPAEGVVRLDRFLARLAMTIREAESRPRRSGSLVESLNDDTERLAYTSLVRAISHLVHQTVESDPVASFPKIKAVLDGLRPDDQRIKAELVKTLSVFGKVYELVPRVIPELYKHLTDFQSNLVRATAIGVLGGMLAETPASIPENMVGLLVIYLEEDFVVIHKAALRALKHHPFPKDERGRKALNSILVWEDTYFQQGEDTEILSDIVRLLHSAFRCWPEVRRYVSTVLVPKHSRHPDPYFAEDSLAQMARDVRVYPEIAPFFVGTALDYFERTQRDRYNIDTHHDRTHIWRQMFGVSPDVVAAEVGHFRRVILTKVGHDQIEAVRLLELLSHVGLHQQAAEIASAAYHQLPDVKSHSYERERYRLSAAAERAEVFCLAGNPQEAAATLSEALVSGEDDGE